MTQCPGDEVERIKKAEEMGYPTEDLDDLLTEAEERYLAKVDQHGPGKNWLAPDAPEARWHIWKACDELFQARDSAHRGKEDGARSHMADALNHMLMALEIARHDRRVGGGGARSDD